MTLVDETGRGIIGFIVVCLLLSTAAICIRFLSRSLLVKDRYQWDDWTALFAYVTFVGALISGVVAVAYGFGTPSEQLPAENVEPILKCLLAATALSWGPIVGSKLSALFFYIRVFRPFFRGFFRASILFAFGLTAVFGFYAPLSDIFQCGRIRKSKKVLAGLVFLLGYLSGFTSLARLIAMIFFSRKVYQDTTATFVLIMYLTAAEAVLAIVSICMPAVLHLYRVLKKHGIRNLYSFRSRGEDPLLTRSDRDKQSFKVKATTTITTSTTRGRPSLFARTKATATHGERVMEDASASDSDMQGASARGRSRSDSYPGS